MPSICLEHRRRWIWSTTKHSTWLHRRQRLRRRRAHRRACSIRWRVQLIASSWSMRVRLRAASCSAKGEAVKSKRMNIFFAVTSMTVCLIVCFVVHLVTFTKQNGATFLWLSKFVFYFFLLKIIYICKFVSTCFLSNLFNRKSSAVQLRTWKAKISTKQSLRLR